ncbi:hypothetical protein BDY24DRAFT_411419 [Mrakia frigida]|uniref:zinc finger MYND domain-containing protein n=1 Tax=Mrakia frigida TaxID=29902 RepID=UPI003FCBF94F
MEVPSPNVLGQLLGLSEDGTAADLSQMSEEDKAKVNPAFHEHFHFEELCSRFLPSLVRTFLAQEYPWLPSSYFTLIHLVVASVRTASFCRFVRSFPNEACTLYLRFSGPLERISANLDEYREATNGPNTLSKLVDVTIFIFYALAQNLPARTPFPSFPLTVSQSLRAVASRSEKEPHLRAEMQARGFTTECMTEMAERFGRDGDPRRYSSSEMKVWWSCETRRAAVETESDCSPCVKLGDGEEMMACSRCLNVRYCSKDHQRSDWKRHKKVCFKPTW